MGRKPSGFVPVPFHLVGKGLLILGVGVLILYMLALVFGWITLPPFVLVFSGALTLLGVYLIFIIPREDP